MKTFKLLAFVSVLSLGLSSCFSGFNGVQGNREVTSEERKLQANVTSVKSSSGLNVYITQSNDVSLRVEADSNLHEFIQTEVEDGVLKIFSKKNIWNAKARNVYVSIPTITSLESTSGSSLKSEGRLKTDNLYLSSSSGSTLKLDIESNNIIAQASSGSTLRVNGTANSIDASSSSGASLRAGDLQTNKASADASSGSSIRVYASKAVHAEASSGASVRYAGSPEIVETDSSSGGSVKANE